MLKCFILAEYSSVQILSAHINQLSLPLMGSASTFEDGFGAIMSNKPDIVYIDMIFVQRYSEELRLLQHKTSFVVISESTADAYAAFEFHAFDYLLKPVKYHRFINSIEKYHSIETRFAFNYKDEFEIQDYFFVKTDTKGVKEVKIFFREIVYIEAMHNQVIVYMEHDKQHIIYNTMKEMEENLPLSMFSRIHKSFIINDDKISYVEGNAVILNENTKLKIIIGNTFRKAFLEKKNKRAIKVKKNRIIEDLVAAMLVPVILILSDAITFVTYLGTL